MPQTARRMVCGTSPVTSQDGRCPLAVAGRGRPCRRRSAAETPPPRTRPRRESVVLRRHPDPLALRHGLIRSIQGCQKPAEWPDLCSSSQARHLNRQNSCRLNKQTETLPDYATADGSAQAGVDYTAASGTLTFDTGESSTTIEVTVLDDAHDEGEETFTLTLSKPSAGRLTDDEATGTIENRDPLPRALLARFGRTAAVHVVEHVEERLQAPREPGFRAGSRAGSCGGAWSATSRSTSSTVWAALPAGIGPASAATIQWPGRRLAGNGPQGLAAGGAYTAGSRPMGAMTAPLGGGPGPGGLCRSDGRSRGSGRRDVRRRTATDGSGRRGRADRLSLRDEPRNAFRRDPLALEPRGRGPASPAAKGRCRSAATSVRPCSAPTTRRARSWPVCRCRTAGGWATMPALPGGRWRRRSRASTRGSATRPPSASRCGG